MTVETLAPVAAPLEPTTPIKPSEALRLGRLTTRPGHFVYVGEEGQACAVGSIAIGAGFPWDGETWAGAPVKEFAAALFGAKLIDEIEERYEGLRFNEADNHQWTDDEIADWLAGRGL